MQAPELQEVLFHRTVPSSLNGYQRRSLKILAFLEQKDYFKTFTWPRSILISSAGFQPNSEFNFFLEETMRTIFSTLILVFLLANQSVAEEGVSKVKKSKLKIDKIGTVTSEVNEIITANIKASKSKNKGKWKGIGGKIFGKFYPKGSDEIINVSENKIHKINRKKKKCETRPLVTEETKESQKSFKGMMQQMRTEQDKHKDLDEEERESNIEILA